MSTKGSYQVDDRELLLGFYKRFLWNGLVEHIPASIAPNTITVLGQVAGVLAVVAAAAGTMGMPVFYLVSAFLWLTYMTADNIDGAHARRTGQTSPLGEFLDHGLDGLASGGVVLSAALILRMDGVWMALFLGLGALGFLVTFWEQYRTGRLIIPAMSSTEGITLLMIVETLMFALGDPTWLRFDIQAMNGATMIMLAALAGYAAAIVGPSYRVHKATGKVGELLPALAIAASAAGYVAAGASAIMPAIMVSLFGADVVGRIITLRHKGQDRPLVAPYHYLLALPLLPALALPGGWGAEAWAALSMVLSVFFYGRTLIRSGLEIVELAEQDEARA